ncbi:O-fucosyltransferase 10-like isoform X2 [Apium graveolens]|uniref:O-fucosyltransferase 10-like isoform X2 n=1 Tax=Apium graveolens TaxID=4045 RepID=UPI003D7BB058
MAADKKQFCTNTTVTPKSNNISFRSRKTARRRNLIGYSLFLVLLYASGLITFVDPISALFYKPSLPGSVYKSHQIFNNLWPHILSDNSSSAIQVCAVWKFKRKLKEQKRCLNKITTPRRGRRRHLEPDYYLIVDANGGLNQQRSSICNAVAVAGLLGATLIIPRFEFHNVWKDPSSFSDIYDEDHFINILQGHVKVTRGLPEELLEKYDNISNIKYLRVPAWASANYYLQEVLPVLQKRRVIRIAPFANRLAVNLPPQIQSLRCLANYEALRFAVPILALARKLVKRMTENVSSSSSKFISVHLRFEEDMVAYSCCVYDGGVAERIKMEAVREKGWGEKFKRKNRVIEPGLNRINGKCPMTPLEVGMMLRGMGFSNNTPIYLASGKIYQAERNLAPLRKMFPLLETKESLAKPDELASFQGYSSRLAALDYMVCLFSEAFVTTQGGNFPHFLMGHRRFLYNGHAKTIKPDKMKLALLLHNTSISWSAFTNEMKLMLAESDRKSIMIPITVNSNKRDSLYSSPFPECRCLWEAHNSTLKLPHTVYVQGH